MHVSYKVRFRYGRMSISNEGEDFGVQDSEYADDTAVLFTARKCLVDATHRMIEHFARFGMDIHVDSQNKTSKSQVYKMYESPEAYDDQDLSNFELGNRICMPVADKFRYLGTMLTRDCRDDLDVSTRIKFSANAFGALRKCLFSSDYIFLLRKNWFTRH